MGRSVIILLGQHEVSPASRVSHLLSPAPRPVISIRVDFNSCIGLATIKLVTIYLYLRWWIASWAGFYPSHFFTLFDVTF